MIEEEGPQLFDEDHGITSVHIISGDGGGKDLDNNNNAVEAEIVVMDESNDDNDAEGSGGGEEDKNEDTRVHVPIGEDVIAKMNCNDLKKELKLRNQKLGGRKPKMIARLREALDMKELVGPPPKQANSKKDGGHKEKSSGKEMNTGLAKVFAEGAYWQPLECETAVMEELASPTFSRHYAPIMDECDRDYISIINNFTEQFERQVFTGEYE